MKFIEKNKVMKYYLEEENYLDSGEEVDVYQIGKDVMKIFKSKDTTRERISEELCDTMVRIKTNRILLPTGTLLDMNTKNYSGYKMRFVRDFGLDNFFSLSSDDLSKEMSILEQDIDLLSDNGILINDLDNIKNISFHNGIYLIDPGSYKVCKTNKKGQIRAYGNNKEEINNLLIRLIEKKAKQICHDDTKVNLMIRKLKKSIYTNNRDVLDYFIKGIEEENLNKLIKTRLEQLECKMRINGKVVNLKNYKRVYFDAEKEIHHSKKDDKVLYLYKTEKNKLKLTNAEIKRLTETQTERIITPEKFVETSRSDCKAFQIVSKYNYPGSIMDMEGSKASLEFELLKKDAISLAQQGIYIGAFTKEDTLYSEGNLYIQCLENLEGKDSDNLEQDNIKSLNEFLTSIIGDELFEVTSLRNYCNVINSLKQDTNDGYIGDTIKTELEKSQTLDDCIRIMVKTRGRS